MNPCTDRRLLILLAGCWSAILSNARPAQDDWCGSETIVTSPELSAGFSIAATLKDDLLVVGAPDDLSGPGQGAAHVFRFDGTRWLREARLSETVSGDFWIKIGFGSAVSTDGSTIAVGSPIDDGGSGEVFVYTHSGSDWVGGGGVVASDREENDYFGVQVAVEGSVLAVLSPGGSRSAVYVFRHVGLDWVQSQKLVLTSDGVTIGGSIALCNGLLAIGTTAGVYLFRDTGTEVKELGRVSTGTQAHLTSLTDRWLAAPGGDGVLVYDISRSGWPLAGDLPTPAHDLRVSGDFLFASDPFANDGRGNVNLFHWSGAKWILHEVLEASVSEPWDLFGFALSADANRVACSVPHYDTWQYADAGAVSVFDCNPPLPKIDQVLPGRGNYRAGGAVSILGDNLSADDALEVYFRRKLASNIVIVDDSTVTCTAPEGAPGPAIVTVVNDLGVDVLEHGFTYTPAILLEGDFHPGGNLRVRYLCDPGDGLFAVLGLPPETQIDTPPFDGQLCIYPYWKLFVVPSWPFDELNFDADIPYDPSLSGLEVLFQALVGPSFAKPKDASWTNCAHLVIE